MVRRSEVDWRLGDVAKMRAFHDCRKRGPGKDVAEPRTGAIDDPRPIVPRTASRDWRNPTDRVTVFWSVSRAPEPRTLMNDDDARRRKNRRDSGAEDHATAAPTALNRRDFLKAGALGVAAGATAGCSEPGAEAATTGAQAQASATAATPQGLPAPPAQPLAAPPLDPVRIGFVGVGGMGTAHVRNLVRIEGCVVTAICDIRAEHAERAAALIDEAGHPRPALYTRGERDFERLCAEEDLDLVYTATPWRWHVPVCVTAMENGKHAATEVPAAYTLDDCWRLVETAERTARHCVMMDHGRKRLPAASRWRHVPTRYRSKPIAHQLLTIQALPVLLSRPLHVPARCGIVLLVHGATRPPTARGKRWRARDSRKPGFRRSGQVSTAMVAGAATVFNFGCIGRNPAT